MPPALSSAIVSEIHSVDRAVVQFTTFRTMQDPLVRFAGPPALFEHHAGGIRGLCDVAGRCGRLRRDVLPYATQSTHDIGVLMAPGARSGDVIKLVLRQRWNLRQSASF